MAVSVVVDNDEPRIIVRPATGPLKPGPAKGNVVQLSRLPQIPVLETGPDFALATLNAFPDQAQSLFDEATRGIPAALLKAADRVSRRWLVKWDNDHLAEIDTVAETLDRPGCYFLSVNYEWGCTTAAKPAPDGDTARLIRVLDWRTKGLGKHIVAARVRGAPAGNFVTLTWPGYTGALQAMAPGRFSAALNQAPMRKSVGVLALDWAANKARVWRQPHMTPAHLLRQVLEEATDYQDARRRLTETPISAPAIFTLAGLTADQTCVIERKETEARIADNRPNGSCTANHWDATDWAGRHKSRPRGQLSEKRAQLMEVVAADMNPVPAWLEAPILNDRTRLVMQSDAASGSLIAQGYAGMTPATQVLELTV